MFAKTRCLVKPDSRLRVALLAESCAAGVGRHVIDLGGLLQSAGHSVHLLYSTRHIDNQFQAGVDRLRLAGVQMEPLPMRHSAHPSDLATIRQIRSYLHSRGPFHVLHSHSTKAGLLGRLAGVQNAACCTIYTPHAFLTMSPVAGRVEKTCAHLMEWMLSRIGSAIVCVSEEEYDHARTIGLPASALYVVPNGIDIDEMQTARTRRAETRAQLGIADDVVCVGFVGRLAKQKAPEFLIDSFARMLTSSEAKTCLVMIGDGPLRAACEARCISLGIREHVLFHSGFSGRLAMSAFDVFALSSEYEGFPYVLIEAIAVGLPIVTTRVGGTSKLVRQGSNGFIVPVGASTEFAAALERLVNEANLRISMGQVSSAIARDFSLSRMQQGIIDVYRSSLAKSHPKVVLDSDSPRDSRRQGLEGV